MIEDIIGFQARVAPDAPAILAPYGATSFAVFDAQVDEMAAALEADRAFTGSRRVGVAINNPMIHWLAVLALLRLGRVSISLPRLGQANGLAALASGRPDLVLRDAAAPGEEIDTGDVAALVLNDVWLRAHIVAGARPVSPCRPAPEDLVRVVLSSGTTGRPKAVPFTLAQADAGVWALMTSAFCGRRTMTTAGPQTSIAFKLFLSTWASGGAVVLPPAPLRWTTLLTTFAPDFVFIAPADLHKLLQDLPQDFMPYGPLTLVTGGSAVSRWLCVEARRRLSARVDILYGSTEAGSTALLRTSDLGTPPGAVGYLDPRTADVEIVDLEGRGVTPGVSGEVRIRGDLTVAGYERGDDEAAFRDGWFHPGDVGRMSADGLLVIEGRTAEFINYGGAKYAPIAIEEVLRTCPGVRDVAAFAMRSATGEVSAHLALVVGDEFRSDAADAALKSHFPKLVMHVMTLPAIPRNAMGKAEHQTLRLMATRKAG